METVFQQVDDTRLGKRLSYCRKRFWSTKNYWNKTNATVNVDLQPAAKRSTLKAQEEAERKVQEIEQQEESRQKNRRDQDWRQLQELRTELQQK